MSENLNNGPEPDPRAAIEAESYYANQGREETYGRQDPDFMRLVNQETPKDVASIMDTIRTAEQWSYQEAIDTYGTRRMLSVALKKAKTFSMSHSDLQDERIVVAKNGNSGELIGADGYLIDKAKVRLPGYSIRVDESSVTKEIVIPHMTFDRDPKEPGAAPIKKEWEVQYKEVPIEKVYFGTEKERIALKNANEWLVRNAITSEKLHQQTGAFDSLRAALDELVKTFYLKQITSTNEQLKWTFTAPDIEKITADNPENRDLGERRNRAMRIFELVGHCETKEKLEKHLNETFNLEEILDAETVERTLAAAKALGQGVGTFSGSEEQIKNVKFAKAVEFLIGKEITITEDPTTKIKKYELGANWLTKDQRDPSKTTDPVEKEKRGAGAIKVEKDVRGFFTQFGNPYVKDSRDIMYTIAARAAIVVGGKDATGAVRDADRRFWLWGERDRLGLEVYAPNAIPTGEGLVDKYNSLTAEQWRNEYAKENLRYFSISGEPVASDLSKLYHPDFWRLKDHLHRRITGELITTGKLGHLAESFMSLNRTEVDLGYPNKSTRSIREQWLGFKGDNVLRVEPAKNLGDIQWEKLGVSGEVMEALTSENVENLNWEDTKLPENLKEEIKKWANIPGFVKEVNDSLSPIGSAVRDGAEGFYWLMNFLAGDGNPDKRPFSMFISKVKPDFLMDSDCYTGKIKFERITNDANGAWGDYRGIERETIINKNAGKIRKDEIDSDEMIKRIALQNVDRTLKAWMAGVRSDEQYPIWSAKKIDYQDDTGSTKMTSWGKFVETMAVKYGFLDANIKGDNLGKVKRVKVV